MIIFNITGELNELADSYGLTNETDLVVNRTVICENNAHHLDLNRKYCEATWDRISCWPTTPVNHLATIPCFRELNGITYDSSQNATKWCLSNGTWAERSDYSRCSPITPEELIRVSSDIWNAKDASTIYYFGYGLSLLALTIALFIFLYFKDLRCVRNTIHTNLMITYELFAITWIITATLQLHQPTNEIASHILCFLYILLPYFTGTKFFWMFIEGLYLYILVVRTFSSIESIKMYSYALIGWGLPAIIVLAWAPLKYFFGKSGENLSGSSCPWQVEDSIDNIFICPILFVLALNIFFLCKIMWVLITKLKSATSAESHQYRKAAKALLVLTPLLGVAYILLLVTPASGPAKTVFTYLQATLYSTQGFTVSVLYCFLNGEVQNSVRHHLERWKTMRTLPKCDHHSLSGGGRKSLAFSSSINSDRASFFRLNDSQRKDSSPCNSLLGSSGIMTVLGQPKSSETKNNMESSFIPIIRSPQVSPEETEDDDNDNEKSINVTTKLLTNGSSVAQNINNEITSSPNHLNHRHNHQSCP